MRLAAILLLAVFCHGCAPPRQAVEIHFAVHYDGQPLSCGEPVGPLQLTDMRFYVHGLRLLGDGNSQYPVEFTVDDRWQSGEVALLDLEDGSGSCQNGTSLVNASVRGLYSGAAVRGIAFELGVPESLNHADPLQAAAPLTYTDMHWHWASGYKFMRVGVSNGNDGFFLHLGSSRCTGTIGNILGCESANRASIVLPEFDPRQNLVVLELAGLLAEIDLQDAAESDCMSGPADEECRGPFASLGIDFASGQPNGTASAFRSGDRQ